MRAYRESVDIMASLLEAAPYRPHRSPLTQMFKATSLNSAYFRKYLEYALLADFLTSSNGNFEITEKGQLFLQKYKEISQNNIDTLKNERYKLTLTFKNKKSPPSQSMRPEQEPTVEIQVKDLKSDFHRLDAKKYYNELITFGFQPQEATKIIASLNIINRSNPTFFSGKKINLIKACLAYTYAKISYAPFDPPRTLKECKIAQYFGTTERSIQIIFKKYMSIIQESQKKEVETKQAF